MRISERSWANWGKWITGATAVVGLFSGGFQFFEHFRGPRLLGVIAIEEIRVPPELREKWNERTDRKPILDEISSGLEKHDDPTRILAGIKKRLEDDGRFNLDDFALQGGLHTSLLHVGIMNLSDEVATDVKLRLPGRGRFELSERTFFTSDEKAGSWTGDVPIGSIRPRSTIEALVWFDRRQVPWVSESTLLPALTHSKGSGTIRYQRVFVGWDSDSIAWFLEQTKLFRYGVPLLLLLAAIGALRLRALRRRKLSI